MYLDLMGKRAELASTLECELAVVEDQIKKCGKGKAPLRLTLKKARLEGELEQLEKDRAEPIPTFADDAAPPPPEESTRRRCRPKVRNKTKGRVLSLDRAGLLALAVRGQV